MNRVRMLVADQLITEELWENSSEKKLEAGGGDDDDDDFLFDEETGDSEGAVQATLEEQVFEKGKDEVAGKKLGNVSMKRKESSTSDAIFEVISTIQKRMDENAEVNRGLKRILKKRK